MELNEPGAKNVVQAGLQQTEIGPIPLDWRVEPLATVADIRSGIAKNVNAVIADAIEVPYLRVANVQDGYLDLQEISTIRINREDLRRYSVLPFDVLMNEGGDIDKLGRGALWRGQIQPCIHQNHVFVVRCKPALAPQFLSAWSASPPARRYFLFAGKQTTNLASINKTSLGQLPVAMPRLREEQERIAQALADADALIESLEQLLAKKCQIKQGAMQELLTGQRRLLGFGGKWRTYKWGEVIAACSSGATPFRGRPDYFKGSIKWITSGELNYNVIVETIEHLSVEAVKATNLKTHPVGTFLMAITGLEAAGTRGSCGIVGSPSTTNQSCMAIYPTSALRTEFLYHYYVLKGNELALNYCQGTKQQSYTAGLIRQLPIDLPPTTEEQTAIATVLSDMDTEITALEARLTKARQLKQGMAQVLLTGRIRLVN